MGQVNLTKSEQDYYDTTLKQANVVIARAQDEANGMISKTIQSICESHDSETPQQCEPIKNKNGKVIAFVWGEDQKNWREGNLKIDSAVYPPGLPLKPAATKGTDGAGAPPAGTTPPATLTESKPTA